jgi:sulfur carrier protein
MIIVLNGEQHKFSAPFTVGNLLEELHLQPEAVVVELNSLILERQFCSEQPLADGDHIEIIRFVGGG